MTEYCPAFAEGVVEVDGYRHHPPYPQDDGLRSMTEPRAPKMQRGESAA